GADVHDQCFLIDLRVVPLNELADTGGAHVGNVNIADTAVGGVGDLLPVFRNPVEVDQIGFVGDGPIGNNSGPVHGGLAVHRQRNRIVRFVAQQTIGVVGGFQLFTVNRQYVIAH